MTETTPSPLGNVITIDDERIKDHLDRVVRGSVEETPSTVSDLNKKIYGTIETWRNRAIEGEHPYVYLDVAAPSCCPGCV
jgi:transposase-like protein